MSGTLLLVLWLAGIPALVVALAELRQRYFCRRRARRAHAAAELLKSPPPVLLPRNCVGGRQRSRTVRAQRARARK